LGTQLSKIGITGSSGFIGGSLATYLNSKGFSIKAFTSNKKNKNFIYLDWENEKLIESEFKDLDVLIHCAWLGSDRHSRHIAELQNKNLSITKSIVKVQGFTNISRIIGVGSQEELIDGEQPWSDDAKILPASEYGIAKYESFNILKESIKNFTWARLFSVYGKNDKRNWIIMNAVRSLRENTPITFGECSKPWSLTHINDVCTAFAIILNKNITGTVNISDVSAPTLRNHLELLQKLAGRKKFVFKPNSIIEREISISSGILHTSGWKIAVDREKGFLDLLK
jgi:nucleoside-diphosphate-sugar epimerase